MSDVLVIGRVMLVIAVALLLVGAVTKRQERCFAERSANCSQY